MTPLKKRFKKHLTFKRFAPKTHEAYIGAVKGLANYYTTAGYMHVSDELISTIKSPLDFLEMETDQAIKTGTGRIQ